VIEHDEIEFGKYILGLVNTDIGWVHLTACDFEYWKKGNCGSQLHHLREAW